MHSFQFATIDEAGERSAVLPIVLEELAKYSEPGLMRLVRRVHVVQFIQFPGVVAVGTSGDACIWVATSSPDGVAFAEWDVRRTIHHEIGNLVFRVRFDELEERGWPGVWKGTHPDDLFGALRAGRVTSVLDAELARTRGFLTTYAALSGEKDFSTVHELQMMSPGIVAEIAADNSALRRKCAIWSDVVRGTGLLP